MICQRRDEQQTAEMWLKVFLVFIIKISLKLKKLCRSNLFLILYLK
jgi:hypothetical protein